MNTGSISNDHLAFVDFRQEHRPEVDRPDPVVGFFQADVMLFERVGDEEQLVLEAKGPGIRDPLDEEVARILELNRPGIAGGSNG